MVLFSCIPPITPAGSSSATLKSALASLPDLKISLPKSLRAESSSSRHMSRDVGTVTELTSGSLASLKSQAWLNLQSSSNNGFVGFLNNAIGFVRSYANSHDVQFD